MRLRLYVFVMSAYRTGRSTNFIIRAAVNNVLYMMSRTPATLCVTFFSPDVSNNTYFHESQKPVKVVDTSKVQCLKALKLFGLIITKRLTFLKKFQNYLDCILLAIFCCSGLFEDM